MPGVVKIVPLDTTYGHGFGVIAENTWAAFKAAEAIEVEWGKPDYPPDSAGDLKVLADALGQRRRLGAARRRRCRRRLRRCAARTDRRGRISRALPVACPMEPMNCHGAAQGRHARHLGAEPDADHRSLALRRSRRRRAGQDQRPHDLDGRRLRPARRDGFLAFTPTLLAKESRRPPGQGDLDARGGHAPRRLPPGRGRRSSRRASATTACRSRST